MIEHAFQQALQAALALMSSHALCSAFVMYMDLSGKWSQYSMNKNRNATTAHYVEGWKSFCVDMTLLFVPFMTFCFWYRSKEVSGMSMTRAALELEVATSY